MADRKTVCSQNQSFKFQRNAGGETIRGPRRLSVSVSRFNHSLDAVPMQEKPGSAQSFVAINQNVFID